MKRRCPEHGEGCTLTCRHRGKHECDGGEGFCTKVRKVLTCVPCGKTTLCNPAEVNAADKVVEALAELRKVTGKGYRKALNKIIKKDEEQNG